MSLDIAVLTESGPRPNNEDTVFAGNTGAKSAVLAVADGLGGHFGGKEASQIAINFIQNVNETELMEGALLRAHFKILEIQKDKPGLRGMATTATAVRISNSVLRGAHCGDTRCIIQRGTGIRKLTVEHTEAQRLFDAGKLTKGDFINYPRRNILDSALGTIKEPTIEKIQFDLKIKDKVLITSDGVHEIVRLREMLELMIKYKSSRDILDAIRERVMLAGPTDNYSAVLAII